MQLGDDRIKPRLPESKGWYTSTPGFGDPPSHFWQKVSRWEYDASQKPRAASTKKSKPSTERTLEELTKLGVTLSPEAIAALTKAGAI